jgi:hypothetical protein
MRPILPGGIHLVTTPDMAPGLSGGILASVGSPAEILRGNSTIFLGPNPPAVPRVGSFREAGGLLRYPGNPACRKGREPRFTMKVDA